MSMDTAETPRIRLPWAGKIVPMEQIEEELLYLWKMSADNLRTGQNIHVRTSVLNLVICAPDIESAQRASRLLRDLSSTHLARVAILILDNSNSTPAGITTWVTLRCFSVISDLMRHCFEQTTLLATGSAIRSVANIIQPLLKPDLPVYLWWLGDPPSNEAFFNSLVELSDRMIVDSTTFFNPEQDISALASLFQSAPDSALSDLNWGRITPWRQLVTQFFDSVEYRPFLPGIYSIEIEHAVQPVAMPVQTEQGDVSPNPTGALLLAGWLKERLDWTLAADTAQNTHDTASGSYLWLMNRSPRTTRSATPSKSKITGKLGNSAQATISIRPQVQSQMRPGSICLVRLDSQVENKVATFTISREGNLENVLTSVELSEETRPQRAVSLTASASSDRSELLRDELEITGHDYLYEQTLQEVAELLE